MLKRIISLGAPGSSKIWKFEIDCLMVRLTDCLIDCWTSEFEWLMTSGCTISLSGLLHFAVGLLVKLSLSGSRRVSFVTMIPWQETVAVNAGLFLPSLPFKKENPEEKKKKCYYTLFYFPPRSVWKYRNAVFWCPRNEYQFFYGKSSSHFSYLSRGRENIQMWVKSWNLRKS